MPNHRFAIIHDNKPHLSSTNNHDVKEHTIPFKKGNAKIEIRFGLTNGCRKYFYKVAQG